MTCFREFVAEVEADETLSPRASMVKLFTGARPFSPIGQFVIWLNVTAGMHYILLMGILNKLLAHWSLEMRADAASLLCSGSEGILSAEMGRWIFALSKSAKAIPEVTACMHGHAPDTMLEALEREPRAKPFVDELERFLDVHGHRGLKEFEMASVRFKEDPSPVLAMIKNYLGADVDAMEMERRSTASRDALIVEIKKKLAALRFERILGLRWRIIDCLARRARYFIKLRENSRFYHIMAWYVARKRILQAERALLAAGKLKVKDDVFYLRWAEVAALVAGELAWREVEDRIRERRLEIIRWSKLTPPKTINIATSRTAERAVFDGESLLGQGAAPGTYEGIARVILDPGIDAQLHPGEILIAPYTDPAWTPLFLTAHAAVVEVGSYLSHAGHHRPRIRHAMRGRRGRVHQPYQDRRPRLRRRHPRRRPAADRTGASGLMDAIVSIALFVLGVHLGFQTMAACYGIIDYWYAIEVHIGRVAVRVVVWIIVFCGFAYALAGAAERAFLLGAELAVMVHVMVALLGPLLQRVITWHDAHAYRALLKLARRRKRLE